MDIKTIIDIAGGPTVVAGLFGISSQAVSQWKQVPIERCLALEEATGGKVTRHDMCPRIFGPSVKKPAKQGRAA